MTDSLESIRRYVLHPDHSGLHLRQLAERMAAQESSDSPLATPELRERKLAAAAETVARFIYLVWGTAGPEEYAPRTYEILMGLPARGPARHALDASTYAMPPSRGPIRERPAPPGDQKKDVG